MKFEVTNIGLKELLKERIDCGEFYIWLAKGLVGRRHSLKLDKSKEPFNNGGLGFFFVNLYYIFLTKLEDQITEMGLKGLVGQFKNLFSYDDTSKDNVKKNREREPIPFYGQFKYFKAYNRTEAYLIYNTFSKHPYLKAKYCPVRVVVGYKSFYLFTTIALFLVSHAKFDICWNIDYFSIKKAESNKNIVKVIYNQKLEGKDYCIITCENDDIARDVAKSLNEEKINNKENLFEV